MKVSCLLIRVKSSLIDAENELGLLLLLVILKESAPITE